MTSEGIAARTGRPYTSIATLERRKKPRIGGIMHFIKKLYLIANLATYAGFAVAFFAFPRALGEAIGYRFETSAALADCRAFYGGLSFGITLVLLRGLRDAAFERAAVLLSVAAAGGLLAGHLGTLAAEGGPTNLYYLLSVASEIVGVGVGLVILRGERGERAVLA